MVGFHIDFMALAGRFLLVTLSILGLYSSAQAQNKIRAAYSSISGIFTPVWIATDERLYQKNQIDADLVYIGGSSVAVSALIAGEIDFIYGGADPIVSGILGGADLTLAGFISNTTPISLYVVPGIARVEDLKGKTVAVTRLASSTAYMAKVCFALYHMEAVKDVPLMQSGGYPESVAAMQAGRVQGALLAPPATYRAEALGFKRVWNGAGVEYPSFVLATRRSFVRDSSDKAQKVFNSVAEGVHIFRTDKERAMRIMRSIFSGLVILLVAGGDSHYQSRREAFRKLVGSSPAERRPQNRRGRITCTTLSARNARVSRSGPGFFNTASLVSSGLMRAT